MPPFEIQRLGAQIDYFKTTHPKYKGFRRAEYPEGVIQWSVYDNKFEYSKLEKASNLYQKLERKYQNNSYHEVDN